MHELVKVILEDGRDVKQEPDEFRLLRVRAAIQKLCGMVVDAGNEKWPGIEEAVSRLTELEMSLARSEADA